MRFSFESCFFLCGLGGVFSTRLKASLNRSSSFFSSDSLVSVMDKTPKIGGPNVQGFSSLKVTAHISPLSDEHLKAIGYVSAAWSLLESIVESGVWGFGSFSRYQGRLTTSDMRIKERTALLGRFAHDRLPDEDSINTLNKMLGKIENSLVRARNDITHATWQFSETAGTVLLVRQKSSKRILQPQAYPKKAEDIMKTGDDILSTAADLQAFLDKHNALPPP